MLAVDPGLAGQAVALGAKPAADLFFNRNRRTAGQTLEWNIDFRDGHVVLRGGRAKRAERLIGVDWGSEQ